MKAEEVVAIGSVGAIAGAYVNTSAPVVPVLTGKGVVPAVVGLAVAVLGYFLDYDGVGDFVEGLGIGLLAGAVL
ncbi:MAG: hypothetical protein QXE51_04595 [Nitrososphaeria archaeon]